MVFAPGYTFADYPRGRYSLQTIEQQIEAFHNAYRVWQLDIALNIVQQKDTGFAVLGILNPYIEMIARHWLGYTSEEAKGKTKYLYCEGVRLMFPSLESNKSIYEQVGKILYESTRCSVAHLGLTGSGIHLSETEYEYPLNIHIGADNSVALLGIHPRLWAEAISDHFEEYVAVLRNVEEADRRAAFSRCFLGSI